MFLFSACDNFLTGKEIKEEIVQAIDYNNAPSYTIAVEALKGSGTIRTHLSGSASQKVTDTFTVKFEPEDDYKFLYWEAEIADLKEGESVSDYIQFESPQSLETKVKFKKASNGITIRPVCPKRLTYSFEQGTGEIFPRDTSLVLNFSEPLSAECQVALDNLTIQTTDQEAATSTYFGTPRIDDKKIIFPSKTTDGYISIPASGQRGISVKIAKEKIWYICDLYSTPVRVYLDSDITQTCFIGPETSQKVKIKYSIKRQSDETPLGTLKVNGSELDKNALDTEEFAYSVGSDLIIRYKLPENYTFSKWTYLGEDGKPVASDKLNVTASYEDNPDTFGYDAASNVAQMTLSIFNPMEQTVTVYPEIIDPVKIIAVKGSDENATMRAGDTILTQTKTDFALGIGKSITFKYKFSDTHKFYGWKLTRQFDQDGQTQTEDIALTKQAMAAINLDYAFDESADSNGFIAALNTAQITITVKDYIDGIINVTPYVSAIPIVTIKLDGKHGKFTPAKDNYQVKEGSINSIGFEADTDWGFVCWKVYNAQTGDELKDQDYITFADYKKENTTYTLLNAPPEETKLAVMPYVLESPNILSRWPQYDAANGSRSDTTIEIVFDHDMDPDCILYTQDELAALPTGVTPLESSVHPGRYYGYETAVGDRVFKNIQLTEKQNNANVAKYYGEPVFEDPMTLFIPVTSPENLTAGKIVIISLSNDLHYKDKETKIPVYIGSSEKKWRYIVNGERDNSAPTYENTISFSINSCDNYKGSDISQFDNLDDCFLDDGSSVTLNLKNVIVTDTESYPTTLFIMEVKRLYDEKYSLLSKADDYSRTIDYDYALGQTAKYGMTEGSGSLELSSLPDGIYSVRYKFRDRSENSVYYPARTGTDASPIDNYFYFGIDTREPKLNGTISEQAASRASTSVTISVPALEWDSNDIKSKKLKYTAEGGSEQSFDIPSFGTDVQITGLAAGTKYTVKAEITDYSGKTFESAAIVAYTKPNAPTGLAVNDSSITQNSFTVNWTTVSGSYDRYILYYKKASDTTYSSKTIAAGNTTCSMTNLSPKTRYNLYLVSVKNNVESESGSSLDIITKPAKAALTKVESRYTEQGNPGFNITWTKPESGTFDTIKLYFCKNTNFNTTETYSQDLTNSTSGTFSFSYFTSNPILQNDTQYYVKIETHATVNGTTVKNKSDVISCYSCLNPVNDVSYDYDYDPDNDESTVYTYPNHDFSKLHTSTPQFKLVWTNDYMAQDSGIQVMKDKSTVIKTIEGSDLNNCVVELEGNTNYKLGIRRFKDVNGIRLYSPINYCNLYRWTKPAPLTFTVTDTGNSFEINWEDTNELGGWGDTDEIFCFYKKTGDSLKAVFGMQIDKNTETSYTMSKPIGASDKIYFYMSIVSTRDNDTTQRWSDTRVVYEPPAKVENLTIIKDTDDSANISWGVPANLRAGDYKIEYYYKWGEDGTYTKLRDFNTPPGQVGETNIIARNQTQPYYCQIRIVNLDGTPYGDAQSYEDVSVTAKLPAMKAVTIKSVSAPGGHNRTATVEWNLPNGGVGEHTGFRVRVKLNNESGLYVLDVDADATQAKVPLTGAGSFTSVDYVYVYTVYENDGTLSMVKSAEFKP